jgi:hypothetical protein
MVGARFVVSAFAALVAPPLGADRHYRGGIGGYHVGGVQAWLDWQRTMSPDNHTEIKAVEADGGRFLGYVRVIGRRRPEAQLEDPIVSVPARYEKKPLLRTET